MRAAGRLGLAEQVELRAQKVQDLDPGRRRFEAAYTLDLLHHLPPPDVRPFLVSLYDVLGPGGILIVKEVSRRPAWKRLFTHALDLLVSADQPPHYFEEHDLTRLLCEVGFDVKLHRMLDILPYPHVLYVCRKSA
jgi:2-polyprenyl-3-methyl-5-hydroxy-6-metoxy-1,4-benzoquinol methylase